jgi:hypothetical protein
MIINHLFTNSNGDSELVQRKIPMSKSHRPSSEKFEIQSLFFRETPQGHSQDYHHPPQKQIIFVTSGILEIETSTQNRFIFQPGDIVFTEDLNGKGHITNSLRGVRGFAHLFMPEDFDISNWELI